MESPSLSPESQPLISTFATNMADSEASTSKEASSSLSMTEESAPASPRPVLTSFTLFSKLPPEIQMLIWRHTFPGPREIMINQQPFNGPAYSRTPNPITLQVCRQSRIITLETYKNHFLAPLVVYINPTIDTICLLPSILSYNIRQLLRQTTKEGRHQIKNLAVYFAGRSATDDMLVRAWRHSFFEEIFEGFSGLDTLVIHWMSKPYATERMRDVQRILPVRILLRAALQCRRYKTDHPEWSHPKVIMKEHWYWLPESA